MEYLKKLLNSVKEILIYEIVMLFTILIIGYVITLSNQGISTEILVALLNDYSLYPIIFITMIMIYAFYKRYLKLRHEYKPFNIHKTLYYVLLGVSVALIINIIFFFINNYIKIYENTSVNSLSLYAGIFITGIVGPILEEILFRGILFNKLKLFNNTTMAIIYSTTIFAITHNNLIQIIYAFVLGFVLVYFYNKYKNILVPIIIHISANTIIILYQTTIFKLNIIFVLTLFILSIICLYISLKELLIKINFK